MMVLRGLRKSSTRPAAGQVGRRGASLNDVLPVKLTRFVMLGPLGEDHRVNRVDIANCSSIPNAVKEVRLSPDAHSTDVLVATKADEVHGWYDVHNLSPVQSTIPPRVKGWGLGGGSGDYAGKPVLIEPRLGLSVSRCLSAR